MLKPPQAPAQPGSSSAEFQGPESRTSPVRRDLEIQRWRRPAALRLEDPQLLMLVPTLPKGHPALSKAVLGPDADGVTLEGHSCRGSGISASI